LFDDTPKALVDQVERVVRLIRSKGVGVYFVSQSPLDIPDAVLGQLGHRVQHALRAFTPKDQKAVKTAAETFRANPKLDVAAAITELGVGEALVSVLDEKGAPTVVERALVYPPRTRLAPLSAEERAAVVHASPLRGHYERAIDRESAFEMLSQRAARADEDRPQPAARGGKAPQDELAKAAISIGTSVIRSMGTQAGRSLVRGVLGALFGGRRR
jgi:DNA helicase HerA-like ATPase